MTDDEEDLGIWKHWQIQEKCSTNVSYDFPASTVWQTGDHTKKKTDVRKKNIIGEQTPHELSLCSIGPCLIPGTIGAKCNASVFVSLGLTQRSYFLSRAHIV